MSIASSSFAARLTARLCCPVRHAAVRPSTAFRCATSLAAKPLLVEDPPKAIRTQFRWQDSFTWEQEEIIIKKLNTLPEHSLKLLVGDSAAKIVAHRQFSKFRDLRQLIECDGLESGSAFSICKDLLKKEMIKNIREKRPIQHFNPQISPKFQEARVVTSILVRNGFLSAITLRKNSSSYWEVASLNILEMDQAMSRVIGRTTGIVTYLSKVTKFIEKLPPNGLFFVKGHKSNRLPQTSAKVLGMHSSIVMNVLTKKTRDTNRDNRRIYRVNNRIMFRSAEIMPELDSILNGTEEWKTLKIAPNIIETYVNSEKRYHKAAIQKTLFMVLSFSHPSHRDEL